MVFPRKGRLGAEDRRDYVGFVVRLQSDVDAPTSSSHEAPLRVRNTCVYPGFRAVLPDLEEAEIR